jgi:AmmeMemoRadiSam system protein B/AmmeMemoRadiSam system protein A
MAGRSKIAFFLRLFAAFIIPLALSSCQGPVKEPAVAGSFYPADARTLKASVDTYLAQATPSPQSGRLVALVSPHAGYIYSGHVAAWGYKGLKDYDTVILIGPSHRVGFAGASVYTEGSFRTPLGDVKIDRRLARSLLNEKAHVTFYPEAFEREHSLEVQLPFLQSVLDEFKIVPILISRPTGEMYAHLAGKLTQMVRRNKRVLIVASTDLSHYHDAERAESMDAGILEALERLSSGTAQGLLATGKGEMCGSYAVLLTLEVAQRVGANRVELFRYAHSGHVTGDPKSVVGYASMGIYMDPLTEADRAELLELARTAIRVRVTDGEVPPVEAESPRLRADRAAFVTIKRNGRLRGCIGDIVARQPLYKSVLRNAANASTRDARFPPMTEAELEDMSVDVSVLSPLMPVGHFKEIKVGRDGVVISHNGRSGVFLPEVATEQGWDRETLLTQVSRKAGLPPDAWKKGARLFRFTTEAIH